MGNACSGLPENSKPNLMILLTEPSSCSSSTSSSSVSSKESGWSNTNEISNTDNEGGNERNILLKQQQHHKYDQDKGLSDAIHHFVNNEKSTSVSKDRSVCFMTMGDATIAQTVPCPCESEVQHSKPSKITMVVSSTQPTQWQSGANEASNVASPASNHRRRRRGRRPEQWIGGIFRKASYAVSSVLSRLEDLMFPQMTITATANSSRSPSLPQKLPRGGVLLYGCNTTTEHYEYLKNVLATVKSLHSADGLRAIGFEYRVVPCDVHRQPRRTISATKLNTEEVTLVTGDDIRSGDTDIDKVDTNYVTTINTSGTNSRSQVFKRVDSDTCFGQVLLDPVQESKFIEIVRHASHKLITDENNNDENTLFEPQGSVMSSAGADYTGTHLTIASGSLYVLDRDDDIIEDDNVDDASQASVVGSDFDVDEVVSPLDLISPVIVSPDVSTAMAETTTTSTTAKTSSTTTTSSMKTMEEIPTITVSEYANPMFALYKCHHCMRRLVHIQSNTIIDEKNRIKFIADGDMYEEVSRLAQEYAFDVMMEEGKLKWITINENDDVPKNEDSNDCNKQQSPPIQALVNSDHPIIAAQSCKPKDDDNDDTSAIFNSRPTLIICTGRGKVRAGIFSRYHLMCNGMESSTCIPYIREALARNVNIFIIDPNVRGEANGYITVQKSMQYWCREMTKVLSLKNHKCSIEPVTHSPLDTYILSHSASGGHLVRFLLEEESRRPEFLPSIQAIAFTDSTHNIQWATKKGTSNSNNRDSLSLFHLLQGEKCVYFRCGNMGTRDTGVLTSEWHLHPPGEVIKTDTYWQHRFGTIKTMWAGTTEHSLANWYAHDKIWEHFDQRLLTSGHTHKCSLCCNYHSIT